MGVPVGSKEVPEGTAVLTVKPYERLNGLKVTGNLIVRMHHCTEVSGCDFDGFVRFEAPDPAKRVRIVGCTITEPSDGRR